MLNLQTNYLGDKSMETLWPTLIEYPIIHTETETSRGGRPENWLWGLEVNLRQQNL
jgi:hypothetical protein